MILKKISPYINSTRQKIQICKNLLTKKNNIIKYLRTGFSKKSGRSTSNGRITVRHIGGGSKRTFNQIDFTKNFFYAIVISTFYDSFRSSFISLVFDFRTNCFINILNTESVSPGSLIVSSFSNTELKLGYKTSLFNVPPGSIVNCLTLKKDTIAKYVKSAGTSSQIVQKVFDTCTLRLPSGKLISVSNKSVATVGKLSNSVHNKIVLGKAGANRLRGKRPSVRGIAMNPVDHPHGGRTNKGMHPVTPWGIPTRGKPTLKKNR